MLGKERVGGEQEERDGREPLVAVAGRGAAARCAARKARRARTRRPARRRWVRRRSRTCRRCAAPPRAAAARPASRRRSRRWARASSRAGGPWPGRGRGSVPPAAVPTPMALTGTPARFATPAARRTSSRSSSASPSLTTTSEPAGSSPRVSIRSPSDCSMASDERGAALRDHVGREVVEVQLQRAEVGGERRHRVAAAGEDRQPHARTAQPPQQRAGGALLPLQPVGSHVAHAHGVGRVEHQDHVGVAALAAHGLHAPQRAYQRDPQHQRRDRHQEDAAVGRRRSGRPGSGGARCRPRPAPRRPGGGGARTAASPAPRCTAAGGSGAAARDAPGCPSTDPSPVGRQ